MKIHIFYISFVVGLLLMAGGCSEPVEHTAPAVRDKDSVAMMVTYGVNSIVSDSGVPRYRIITERWEVNMTVNRQMNRFLKGAFLLIYDDKFGVAGTVQADTAYYYIKEKLWELRGRVRTHFMNPDRTYRSEELFWNMDKHEYYGNRPFKVVTPDMAIDGDRFTCDEKMTKYHVWNTNGEFERNLLVPSDTTRNAGSAAGGTTPSPMFQGNTTPYRIGESPASVTQDSVKAEVATEEKKTEETDDK